MRSVKEVFKIGRGPSSSHTMGPEKAAQIFKTEHPDADAFQVRLYGSLCKTGKDTAPTGYSMRPWHPFPQR